MFELTQLDYPTSSQLHVSSLVDGLLVMLEMLLPVIAAGALALASAAAGSISQYILWKANRLPLRTLGALGLMLLLLSFGFQAVPAVMDLLSIYGTPK